jgi:hypothetical protein
MSTKLHDLPTNATLSASVSPQVATTTQNGSSVDLIAADGSGFAMLFTGTVAGGTTVGGKVQESADASSWSDIAGATFTNTTTSNAAQAVAFQRTMRYVRCVVTLAGGSPSAGVCAAVGMQKKVA